MKRPRGEKCDGGRAQKVRRVSMLDRLSKLSEELLVRILSFVPVPSLLDCQRVSKRLSRLSVDGELWKAAYYKRFVLPRALRIPGLKEDATSHHLHYSSNLSKWLDDEYLVKNGLQTNWKQQYRLRHNWARGQCAVSEIIVAERPCDPPLLVMLSSNMIYTADSFSGLRAWSTKSDRNLLASIELVQMNTNFPQLPTSMAIDSNEASKERERIVIGFEDGTFTIYLFQREESTFEVQYSHPPSINGMLSALAYSSPYLLTMTKDNLLSIYAFQEEVDVGVHEGPPRVLYSLRSHTAWPPISPSLRTNVASITAAIAYSLPTYLSGWTVGIQEMRLSLSGELLESRLATPSLTSATTPSKYQPTSMSYSHPYLLVSHPDNSLSSYLVRSTSSALSIGPGDRLSGHTSAISGAHVGMRGKAVSVSRLGDEIRVWDLERGMTLSTNKRQSRNGEFSVRVQPAKPGDVASEQADAKQQKFGLRFALEQGLEDLSVSQGWVGFDDQNVIVLREKSRGSQALAVYDFT